MSEQNPLEVSERLLGRFDFTVQLAEIEQENRAVIKDILNSVISVMDSFDRLLGDVQNDDSRRPEQFNRNTVRLIARQLMDVLRKAGANQIDCLNTVYDPDKHVIADLKDVPGVADETIVQEITKGYEWHGEILRPPHVIIASAKSRPKKER